MVGPVTFIVAAHVAEQLVEHSEQLVVVRWRPYNQRGPFRLPMFSNLSEARSRSYQRRLFARLFSAVFYYVLARSGGHLAVGKSFF